MCRTTRSFKPVDWLQDREIRQSLYPTANRQTWKILSYDNWNKGLGPGVHDARNWSKFLNGERINQSH